MSASASSSSAATLPSRPSRCATASESRSRACVSESALKIGRISAASSPCWSLRAWPRQSRRKCTVQRCQAQPSTFAIAAFSPACASEIASCTPTRPRLTRSLRKSVQNASVSDSPTSRPRISRRPVSCTPCAITSALLTTRPPSRTFSTLASRKQIGVSALKRPGPERLHVLVERLADPADLALGYAQPQALDELVDPPRRHPAHVRLLDHAEQRLLRAPARLQERREVGPAAQLGDLQLDRARPRLPLARPITVAMRHPVIRPALAELGPNLRRDLALHQLPAHRLQRGSQHVAVLSHHHLLDDLLDRHPVGTGHRWRLLSSRRGTPDDHGRHGGRNHA